MKQSIKTKTIVTAIVFMHAHRRYTLKMLIYTTITYLTTKNKWIELGTKQCSVFGGTSPQISTKRIQTDQVH